MHIPTDIVRPAQRGDAYKSNINGFYLCFFLLSPFLLHVRRQKFEMGKGKGHYQQIDSGQLIMEQCKVGNEASSRALFQSCQT